jgi:acyl-CoA dehydrogenase
MWSTGLTFITNGFTANLLVVAVRTGGAGGSGCHWSCARPTENPPGFRWGGGWKKLGCTRQTRPSCFFDGVRWKPTNCLARWKGVGISPTDEPVTV